MNETIIIVFSTSTVTILLLAIIGFFMKNWFLRKVQYAVKFEYDKKIEELKDEKEKRSKANLVAELISEWLSFPLENKTLNKLTFEAFLWLPQPIASKLSGLLSHKSDAPKTREVINDVRNYLLQNEDKISEDEIIIFTQEKKSK